MKGEGPSDQDEASSDASQGPGFEEAELLVNRREDLSCRDLSERQKELGTPKKAHKNGNYRQEGGPARPE